MLCFSCEPLYLIGKNVVIIHIKNWLSLSCSWNVVKRGGGGEIFNAKRFERMNIRCPIDYFDAGYLITQCSLSNLDLKNLFPYESTLLALFFPLDFSRHFTSGKYQRTPISQ